MGSGFSVPNANDVLQSYGSIPLLNTLAQAKKVEDFVALDDASVESIEPLLTMPPQAIYEHSSLLCSRVGTVDFGHAGFDVIEGQNGGFGGIGVFFSCADSSLTLSTPISCVILLQ